MRARAGARSWGDGLAVSRGVGGVWRGGSGACGRGMRRRARGWWLARVTGRAKTGRSVTGPFRVLLRCAG